MLSVRAGSAPGYRRGRLLHPSAVLRHRFPVRFHLELLEIGWEQPQPLVIGEDRARLAFQLLGIKPVGERCDERHVFGDGRLQEVPIHLSGAFETRLELLPA